MKIVHAPPADRGVTQLVYVGDDDAVDKAVTGPSPLQLLELAALGLVAYKTSGAERAIAIGILGYSICRVFKAQR